MVAMREIVAVQPVAIVDHIVSVEKDQLEQLVGSHDAANGSRQCSLTTIQEVLAAVGEFTSKAGGSASNTCRGLAAGFGIDCHLVGARGNDEWGAIFNSSLRRAGVHTSGMRVTKGPTGRSVILSSQGQRTMRTASQGTIRLPIEELTVEELSAKFVFTSAYCLYGENFLQAVSRIAHQAGSKVMLDLASWEVVSNFLPLIKELLESGHVYGVFCNEDEAAALMELPHGDGGDGDAHSVGLATATSALDYITQHCQIGVVTLGEHGCLAMTSGGGEKVEHPATQVPDSRVVDTTGAGDLFASGFVYGLLQGYELKRCCEIGCIAGAAVVQVVGAELPAEKWKWFHSRMHGELAASVVRGSADAVHKELLAAYALVAAKGRGVVYYGSARLRQSSQHWEPAKDLGRDVSKLLNCTTWSGGGPGMMQAASIGAMEGGRVAAGIRIAREAGNAVLSASYLPDDCQVMCRFLSSRKVALTDAGVRNEESDRTAFIFLPGGLGTMDELFELLCLIQLKKLGSKLGVPLILCNYDGFYTGLMDFLVGCDQDAVLKADELQGLVLADTNEDVLRYLAQFYKLPLPASLEGQASRDVHIQKASVYIENAITAHAHKSGRL